MMSFISILRNGDRVISMPLNELVYQSASVGGVISTSMWSTKPLNLKLKFSDSMVTALAVSGSIRRIVKLKVLDVNRLMVKSCLGNFNTDIKVRVFWDELNANHLLLIL